MYIKYQPKRARALDPLLGELLRTCVLKMSDYIEDPAFVESTRLHVRMGDVFMDDDVCPGEVRLPRRDVPGDVLQAPAADGESGHARFGILAR